MSTRPIVADSNRKVPEPVKSVTMSERFLGALAQVARGFLFGLGFWVALGVLWLISVTTLMSAVGSFI